MSLIAPLGWSVVNDKETLESRLFLCFILWILISLGTLCATNDVHSTMQTLLPIWLLLFISNCIVTPIIISIKSSWNEFSASYDKRNLEDA